ncbi:MAG: hypothetical protein R3Y09_13190, partial [Clostridia bacterium]
FNVSYLNRARELNVNVNLHYLVSNPTVTNVETCLENNFVLSANYANASATAEWLVKAIADGVEVGIWTMNEPNLLEVYRKMGVKYITTDFLHDYTNERLLSHLTGLNGNVTFTGYDFVYGNGIQSTSLFNDNETNGITSKDSMYRARMNAPMRLAGCDSYMFKNVDPKYRVTIHCYDAMGRMLKDRAWQTENILYDVQKGAVYGILYLSNADDSSLTEEDIILFSDIKFFGWHRRQNVQITYDESLRNNPPEV